MTVTSVGPRLRIDPAGFVAAATALPGFRADGVVSGSDGPWQWWVVDPERHPLHVWRRAIGVASYARSATALGATVFSNGPMMGRRHRVGGKITRIRVPLEFAFWTAAGAAAAVSSASVRSRASGAKQAPLRRWAPAGLLGGLVGAGLAWRRVFSGWVPCGGVVAGTAGIEDRRNFDSEGDRHAWFGRTGTDFSSHTMADGDVPAGVAEGMGGLIRLVREHRVVTRRPATTDYGQDFADLADKPGVVAWALVPTGEGQGVLLVLGGGPVTAGEAGVLLADLGARDAVATDQSGCAMLGQGREFALDRPSLPRRTMQVYGLCCR